MVSRALLGVGVAALDRVHPAADADDTRAGGAAVAPVDAGGVVAGALHPTRIGEGGYRLAGAGLTSTDGHHEVARGYHRRVADRRRAAGRGRRVSLLADADGHRVRLAVPTRRSSDLGVGVAALDRVHPAPERDGAVAGGRAIAPVDAGAVVAGALHPTRIGEGG